MQNEFLTLMAIGDACGMRLEFVDHGPITKNDLYYGPHPKFAEYQTGNYTDDTQMSLANAELMLNAPSLDKLTDDDFINSWLTAFRRDPHVGYTRFKYNVMTSATDAADFKNRLDAKRGTASGAAMRVAAIGLLPDVKDVQRLAVMQARITHDTPAGITSASAVALAVHFLHHGGTHDRIIEFIAHHLRPHWADQDQVAAADMKNGLTIAKQAITALIRPRTLSGVMVSAFNQGRNIDADTLGAIAMAMASRDKSLTNDLSQDLYDGLEHGEFGLPYLQAIDRKLLQKFPALPLYQTRFSTGLTPEILEL